MEVIDKYGPDLIRFDFGLQLVHGSYKEHLVAYYSHKAEAQKKEVSIKYKHHDVPPGARVDDLELGQERDLTYHEWITDTA